MFAKLYNFHVAQLIYIIGKAANFLYLVVHCSAQATQKTDTSIYYPEYNCNDRMLCPFLDIWSLLVVMEQFVFGSGIYPPLNLSECIYM